MGINYKEYNEKYRLPEQEYAEKMLLTKKHFILGFEPGKGKSYPVIHCIKEVERIKQRPIKVLIMSDATCIKDMWKAEIWPQKVLPKETYFVTDRTAIGNVMPALLETKWDIIVVDECQSLRSGVTRAPSKYSKLVHKLTRETEYVWGMTGTIAGNNNIEPWCVLHHLNMSDAGKMSTYAFKAKYCVQELGYGPFGNFMKPTKLNVDGEALMQRLYQDSVMFWDYDDSDNMPEFNVIPEYFTVKKTQEYKDALDGILKCADTESTIQKTIAIQKAQQALNGFIYYDDCGVRKTYYLDNYTNPKLKYISTYCKLNNAIIAYRFQEDEWFITNELKEHKITYVTDLTEFKRRTEQGEHLILVAQCSRGKSVNLQACQTIIYYSSDFSFISFKQMIHRCWRRGQENACNVIFLINDPQDKHKVEAKIWDSLMHKKSIHDALMNIKRIDMEVILK